MRVERLTGNPIIHPGLSAEIGTNINGPSLILAPEWLPGRLARYYLYFAHHGGTHIRLAVADDLTGPWRVIPGGTLRLEQTVCRSHIASPDVHVDGERREIRMYFHGGTDRFQETFLATSSDGRHFVAHRTPLAPFYLRVFPYGGAAYGIAKDRDQGGFLLRSPDGLTPFAVGSRILPRMRHAAVRRMGDQLHILFSRGGDCPEHILHSRMPLVGDWQTWQPGEPETVLTPELAWEGGELSLAPSSFGAIHAPARQLRDPAWFVDDGHWYLLYSTAGESGLAIARVVED